MAPISNLVPISTRSPQFAPPSTLLIKDPIRHTCSLAPTSLYIVSNLLQLHPSSNPALAMPTPITYNISLTTTLTQPSPLHPSLHLPSKLTPLRYICFVCLTPRTLDHLASPQLCLTIHDPRIHRTACPLSGSTMTNHVHETNCPMTNSTCASHQTSSQNQQPHCSILIVAMQPPPQPHITMTSTNSRTATQTTYKRLILQSLHSLQSSPQQPPYIASAGLPPASIYPCQYQVSLLLSNQHSIMSVIITCNGLPSLPSHNILSPIQYSIVSAGSYPASIIPHCNQLVFSLPPSIAPHLKDHHLPQSFPIAFTSFSPSQQALTCICMTADCHPTWPSLIAIP